MDLFSEIRPKIDSRSVGKGNGLALADIALGVPVDTIRAKFKAGEYPDASAKLIRDNLKFWGRI